MCKESEIFRVPCLTIFSHRKYLKWCKMWNAYPLLKHFIYSLGCTMELWHSKKRWNIPQFLEIKMRGYQAINERKMQLSLTFLSWQDGKPLEPVTAGGELTFSLLPLSLLQAAAQGDPRAMQGSQHPHTEMWGISGWLLHPCASPRTHRRFLVFFHAPGWGRQGWNRRNSTLPRAPPFTVFTVKGGALYPFSSLHPLALMLFSP